MGYLHIENLYKNTEIMLFKECYALEKIHGTSANIKFKDNKVSLHPGGCGYDAFKSLFNIEHLTKKFKELFNCDVTVFGEAFGGKIQGMSGTYGKELNFIVFEVRVGTTWLDVPNAENVAHKLGLEFVDYCKIPANLESIDKERTKPSSWAIKKGIKDKKREGVVLRPLIELTKNDSSRIIVKHKNEDFIETRTMREVDPTRLKVLEEAKAIAEEWVTPRRLEHVLDKLGNIKDITKTGTVIKAMIEDVLREAKGEIVESKEAITAIGKKTASLYKGFCRVVVVD